LVSTFWRVRYSRRIQIKAVIISVAAASGFKAPENSAIKKAGDKPAFL
jgi:hypothetical protein